MWPTIDGVRVLKDQEASLVRAAIALIVDHMAAQRCEDAQPWQSGIDWFDQWDVDQRLWLLEQVTVGLFTPASPPSPAAMWEATIDAVFCQVMDLITDEIDQTPTSNDDRSWRRRAMDAFRCQHGRYAKIDPDEVDIRRWRTVVTQIADSIQGITSYQKAESFRDVEIERSRRFLIQKGMPEDFLEQIPPLRTAEQAQKSIDRIQSILGD
jgi:hypothetical protein